MSTIPVDIKSTEDITFKPVDFLDIFGIKLSNAQTKMLVLVTSALVLLSFIWISLLKPILGSSIEPTTVGYGMNSISLFMWLVFIFLIVRSRSFQRYLMKPCRRKYL